MIPYTFSRIHFFVNVLPLQLGFLLAISGVPISCSYNHRFTSAPLQSYPKATFDPIVAIEELSQFLSHPTTSFTLLNTVFKKQPPDIWRAFLDELCEMGSDFSVGNIRLQSILVIQFEDDIRPTSYVLSIYQQCHVGDIIRDLAEENHRSRLTSNEIKGALTALSNYPQICVMRLNAGGYNEYRPMILILGLCDRNGRKLGTAYAIWDGKGRGVKLNNVIDM